MNTPEPEIAIRAAIRHWPRLTDLADFAAVRHGYGDNNGGFGVVYPGDLDDHDREVEGYRIPEGFIEVYGFWGSPDGYDLLVPEVVYLDVLARELDESGLSTEAARVRSQLE